MSEKARPIIVIKKKGGHGGHHGGAWKVAYADFVTAMMSLFIVLWLMSSSSKVKEAVAGYFNDPKGSGKLMGTMLEGKGKSNDEAHPDTKPLEKLKEKIEAAMKAQKQLQELSKQVQITITPEGLRIELIEDKKGTFFELGSPKLSQSGQTLLSLLAGELKTMPNSLLIEGYTDATPYSSDNGYSNWDLSADRANSARRLMQQSGVRNNQVTQVRGYADQLLRVPSNPADPSNRRISILVKNDTESVPVFSARSIVDGKTPLPSAKADAKAQDAKTKSDSKGKPSAEAKRASAANDVSGKASGSDVASTVPPDAKAPLAAPEVKAALPAAKPGFMARLKALLPGHTAPPPQAAAPPVPEPAAPASAPASSSTPANSGPGKPGLIDRLKAMLPGHKS
jgi:chemotaxis protein MotB